MSDAKPHAPATAADLIALGDVRAEIIDGVLVPKEAATYEHCDTQSGLVTAVRSRFFGPRGGWWLATEAEVEYEAHQVFRHDVAGWRRERGPARPAGRPVQVRPDWVCEVLSPSNWANDTVKKYRVLHRHGVPWYWVADVEHGVLTVFQWQERGYLALVVAEAEQRLRLPPFDDVELDVGVLFGGDPAAEG